MSELIFSGLLETIAMVTLSCLFGIILGAPMAVLLYISSSEGPLRAPILHGVLSFVVNALRSIPYIILTIALIPMTRHIVGSSIGLYVATVPLTICASLLIARVIDESLRNLPFSLLELGKTMGISNFKIITKILLPEAAANIVSGITIVVVNLVGFSAMAGTVGGGGLGNLAIRYGYQRYDIVTLLIVVGILIMLVQAIQFCGDQLVCKLRK